MPAALRPSQGAPTPDRPLTTTTILLISIREKKPSRLPTLSPRTFGLLPIPFWEVMGSSEINLER